MNDTDDHVRAILTTGFGVIPTSAVKRLSLCPSCGNPMRLHQQGDVGDGRTLVECPT